MLNHHCLIFLECIASPDYIGVLNADRVIGLVQSLVGLWEISGWWAFSH